MGVRGSAIHRSGPAAESACAAAFSTSPAAPARASCSATAVTTAPTVPISAATSATPAAAAAVGAPVRQPSSGARSRVIVLLALGVALTPARGVAQSCTARLCTFAPPATAGRCHLRPGSGSGGGLLCGEAPLALLAGVRQMGRRCCRGQCGLAVVMMAVMMVVVVELVSVRLAVCRLSALSLALLPLFSLAQLLHVLLLLGRASGLRLRAGLLLRPSPCLRRSHCGRRGARKGRGSACDGGRGGGGAQGRSAQAVAMAVPELAPQRRSRCFRV